MTQRKGRRMPGFLFLINRVLVLGLVAKGLAGSSVASVRVECRTAFDDHYFYIGANVQKDALRGSVTAPFRDPYQDDCFAVFLATEPSQDSTNSERRVEMAVSVAQGAQLYRGVGRVPLQGFEDFLTGPDGLRVPFKYQVRLRGELNGAPSPENGFSVELAVPWTELGGPPKPGTVLRFNAAVIGVDSRDVPLATLSPNVRSRDDLTKSDLWGRLVFTDAPVSSVAGVPGAFVCSRVYNVRPLIDGVLAEGEWSRVTAFAFEGMGTPRRITLGSTASARSRAPVPLRPPRRPNALVATGPVGKPVRKSRQEWPRLVFARYRVDYQCDPRKNLPLRSAAAPSGQTLLVTHPLDGTGPWFSYDRVDWHRIQLTRMREAGVDVAAVTVRPDWESRLALTALAAALSALETNGSDYPSVCFWLDGNALGTAGFSAASACDALRMFFECVPARFVAHVPLLGENGPGVASVVVLDGLQPPVLDEVAAEMRARMPGLIILGTVPSSQADATVPSAAQEGLAISEGALRIASLYAGSVHRESLEHPLARRVPNEYRSSWRRILTNAPDWVFIESWNDHTAGSEIVPTVEYGLEYLDITKAHANAFSSKGAVGGSLIYADLPARAAANTTCAATFVLRNLGSTPWTPEDTSVVLTWDQGQTQPPIAVSNTVAPGELGTFRVRVPIPNAPGVHRLRIGIQKGTKKGASTPNAPPAQAGMMEVEAVAASDLPWRAHVVAASLPRAAETPSSYTVTLTLRNDGSAVWRGGETYVTARLLEEPAAGGQPVLTDMADASIALSADVPPGGEAKVDLPITFARPDGSPFRFSSEGSPRYLLRLDVDIGGEAAVTLPADLREIQLVETDAGVTFFNDYTPSRLPGGRRVPVPIGVRNRGPQTWLRDQVAVGYHWYYFDGVEAVWEDELFPVKVDVPPGAELGDIGAYVTAPPHDGTYWLVWDLRLGDTWISTLPGVRAYETRVTLVRVVDGRLHFVDLQPAAELRAAAAPVPGDRVQFDTEGRAYPAELTPPFTINVPVPATLWLPEQRSGTARSRQISFAWLPSSGPSAVPCRGQELSVGNRRRAPTAKKVHLLVAAVRGGMRLEVTLRFANGSEQLTTFPVKAWDGVPEARDSVAFAMPYSRSGRDGSPGPPVFVYWYTVEVKETQPLTSLLLGNAPDVRILAVTVER